jgi:hypothetical protein
MYGKFTDNVLLANSMLNQETAPSHLPRPLIPSIVIRP